MPSCGFSICLLIPAFSLGHCFLPIRAQTVGPTAVILDDSLVGGAFGEVVVFEPDGTFVAWEDTRNENTTDVDIYVQKLGSNGLPAWTTNGVPVCVFPQQQEFPAVVGDGMGGAVVAWREQRDLGAQVIYAQRISSDGQSLWQANGLPIGGTEWGTQTSVSLHRAPDGNFLCTYGETRAEMGERSYWAVAQKIDAEGQKLWGPNGIDVVEGVETIRSVPDDSGGLIVFGRLVEEPDGFRFQRLLADGSVAWPNPVDVPAELPFSPEYNFTSDGAGGILLAYIEGDTVGAIRVTDEGALPWTGASAILADSDISAGESPAVASDGAGGGFVTWISESPREIHAQHIAPDGAHLWGPGGVVVPNRSGTEFETAIVGDGAGGVFLAYRATGIRVQRLDSSGAAQWRTEESDGLNLMTGFEPVIGLGASGPIVVYEAFTGLSARSIETAQSGQLRLVNLAFSPAGEVSLMLTGGVPDQTYNVLRATVLANPPSSTAWTVVGAIQTGASWTDASPPFPAAFYRAAEPSP